MSGTNAAKPVEGDVAMADPTHCKGCWELRNNCGRCTKCKDTALDYITKQRVQMAAVFGAVVNFIGVFEIVKVNGLDTKDSIYQSAFGRMAIALRGLRQYIGP